MNQSDRNILQRKLIPVRWGDMDAFSHVNNTRFLRYVEEIRVDWFSSFEFGWVSGSSGPVVVKIECQFLRPIHWPATVAVDLSAEWQGGKSMLLHHHISDADDPEVLYGKAQVVIVWMDTESGRAIPLPAGVLQAIGE